MKIAVIMSTYNGQKYIEDQIKSIFDNKLSDDITLYVRDDGSTDNTCAMLNEMSKNFHIDLTVGNNMGYKKSFEKLVYDIVSLDYDIYYFADQDDIWHKDKIAVFQHEFNCLSPRLVFSNAELMINSQLSNQFLYEENYDIWKSFQSLFMYGNIYGMAMAINKELMTIIKSDRPVNSIAHDNWIPIVAHLSGDIVYVNKPLVYYRVHDKQQIGVSSSELIKPTTLLGKINKIFAHPFDKIALLFKTDTFFSERARLIDEMRLTKNLTHQQISLITNLKEVRHSVFSRIKVLVNPLFRGKTPYYTVRYVIKVVIGNL
ncbi:glycosyltransferase [Leuconostoc sp. MS02]|uniref:Glycosyltransferase n=1 Tax=Leuconostoc aquikimchii TaxID=3236804 RepID=A0ABV3S3J4_9LACO